MMDLQRVNEYMSQVEESEKKVLPHGKRLKTGARPWYCVYCSCRAG